jgi:uncharacterized protein (TIGR03382 family)
MAYTIAIGVAGVAAEGVNYWQGTPPTADDLQWLLFWVEVGGGIAAAALAVDGAAWLWRRSHRKSN